MDNSQGDIRSESHILLPEPTRTFVEKVKSVSGFVPQYFHKDEESLPLEEQLKTTISSIESKELRDDYAYYLLDFRVTNRHPIVSRIIKQLRARILAELDETSVLIASTLDALKISKSKLPYSKTARKSVFSIRDLQPDDIIDPELSKNDGEHHKEKDLTINLVPSIGRDRARKFLSILQGHLEKFAIPTEDYWIDDETGDSYINAALTRNQLLEVIQKSSFVFKVHEKAKYHPILATSRFQPFKVHIENMEKEKLDSLPKICVIDTGVNEISQLTGLIVKRTVEPPITSVEDLDDHGTSVASLAAYGDHFYDRLVPRARIISHKIHENNTHGAEMAKALSNAIAGNPDCKTYSCSIIIDSSKLAYRITTQRINKISQRSSW